jgi:septum formation protein
MAEGFEKMNLILASGSPRRKELLQSLGHPFVVDVPHCAEVFDLCLGLDEALEQVALTKAQAAAAAHPEDVILAADTIVVLDGQILGKPKNAKHAKDMLESLSGRDHEVKTGVALIAPWAWVTFVETTKVHFRNLSKADIEAYVASGACMDKAGAYGIQECDFVQAISGPYDNVVGLPMDKVRTALKDLMAEADNAQ